MIGLSGVRRAKNVQIKDLPVKMSKQKSYGDVYAGLALAELVLFQV
jgi:hypothetical protein